jgi:hypothetical protein
MKFFGVEKPLKNGVEKTLKKKSPAALVFHYIRPSLVNLLAYYE